MNVSVFGLGYVGCVNAGCLASLGNNVIGVDVALEKVKLINNGKPTVIEKYLDMYIKEARRKRKLEATIDVQYAILNSEISLIAVGTPSNNRKQLDMKYVYRVAEQIGKVISLKKDFHVIAIKSTVTPGTSTKVAEIIEQLSGKKCGEDFAVISNPDFLREGSAVNDFLNPAITVIGYDCNNAKNMLLELYDGLPGEKICTDIDTAEMIKFVNNTYHALKVAFANEVGNICQKLDIDGSKVMEIFCRDTNLNMSSAYLKPGFAYGGPCLVKDSAALKALAKDFNVDTPIINNIGRSNWVQQQKAFDMIVSKKKSKIGVLGLSFKPDTDDLRYSPAVTLVESLLAKGFNVKIYDKNVKVSDLIGENREYIEKRIPHIQGLITDRLQYVIENSELIVIVNKEKEFENVLEKCKHKIVIDLVRMWDEVQYDGIYEGISWSGINRCNLSDKALLEKKINEYSSEHDFSNEKA
ncbi:nucleotide sugar dehydrogenase [Clostridium oryzae]|uniref:UDP-glucose 6-dehydrogenase n=1 Tax=Clostridium oryzae TaxID=1450648 RepID=A0A1V4IYA4_9CLOT|nr:nucleotide sugar dehydrogenase [Clostridium oryzae]OPJ65048.1 GDP-mannose 6-dehydrogenase [Clostridium oryzae]